MKLTRDQITELRSKSAEGAYQAIRDLVREEFGSVDKDELREALEDAVDADILDERDVRKAEEGY